MGRAETSLNICTWNVGGMITEGTNKCMENKFIEQIKNFDIVLLTETHIGYSTNITVNNFSYYPVCRNKSNNNRYFGGLGILIKKNIRKGISVLQNTNTEFQWLKLKKEFFQFKTDIYLCLVYIPPHTQNNIDILELMEKDIIKYRDMGDIDFNARTGNEPDYIKGDSASHTVNVENITVF
jgi:hypothetical protein